MALLGPSFCPGPIAVAREMGGQWLIGQTWVISSHCGLGQGLLLEEGMRKRGVDVQHEPRLSGAPCPEAALLTSPTGDTAAIRPEAGRLLQGSQSPCSRLSTPVLHPYRQGVQNHPICTPRGGDTEAQGHESAGRLDQAGRWVWVLASHLHPRLYPKPSIRAVCDWPGLHPGPRALICRVRKTGLTSVG